MEYRIYVLPGIRLTRGPVLIFLPGNLETRSTENLLQFIIHPASSTVSVLPKTPSHVHIHVHPHRQAKKTHVLDIAALLQGINLALVPPEHILVAAGEIRVHLPR
jgi:hypothetical protein